MSNSSEPNPFLLSNFITSFIKMYNDTKYNLQALNKRFDFMEKTVNNILQLNNNVPFDESEEKDEEQIKKSEENQKEDDFAFSESDIITPIKEKKTKPVTQSIPTKKAEPKPKKAKKTSEIKEEKIKTEKNIPNEDALDKIVSNKKVNKFQEFLRIKKEKEQIQEHEPDQGNDIIDQFFNDFRTFNQNYNCKDSDEESGKEEKYLQRKRKSKKS